MLPSNNLKRGNEHNPKGKSERLMLCFNKYEIPIYIGGCLRGVMVKAIDCGIVVREFVLQSCYYVHFRTNTLGKGN